MFEGKLACVCIFIRYCSSEKKRGKVSYVVLKSTRFLDGPMTEVPMPPAKPYYISKQIKS